MRQQLVAGTTACMGLIMKLKHINSRR